MLPKKRRPEENRSIPLPVFTWATAPPCPKRISISWQTLLPRGLRESCGIMVNYIYTSGWLGQIRRSFGWFDRLEIRGLFAKGP